MAFKYNFLSWNVRGLSDVVKRQALFSILKSFPTGNTLTVHYSLSMLKNSSYQMQFHSTHTAYSRGVSILISNDVSFELLHSKIDDQGQVNPFWLQLFPAEDPLPRAITTFLRCNRGSADPGIVWDAFKAHLRGLIIKQISVIKSHTTELETLVSAEARKAKEHYIAQPSPESEHSSPAE